MSTLLELMPVAVWALLWMVGGWLLTTALFRLRRGETAIVGLAMGLVLETWLANLLAHAVPFLAGTWISAGAVCVAGVACVIALRGRPKASVPWLQLGMLGAIVFVLTLIGRGLGIFDDYQNLPTISLMATGDVPPHFALNPSLNFGYHYLLLLFAAQLMRLGAIFPWTALDVARGLMMALPIMLAGYWAYRLTRSQLAAGLSGAVLAFAGGSRWLLLLLPHDLLLAVSGNVKLIGSASTSAATLAEALLGNWKIDGAGPIPFPFAFYTGINQPFVMSYTGISGSGILILLILLLSAGRRRHWGAAAVEAMLAAALALANEIAFLLLALGFGFVVMAWIVRHRSWRAPRDLAVWTAMLLAAAAVAVIQGGLLTEIVRTRLAGLSGQAGYFDTSLNFVWPPAIVSAHLGSLSLVNPSQLLVGLLEIGPIVLVTPLAFAWARRSFRLGRWYEASLIASSGGTLVALLLQFKGPLFTATPRLMSGWFFACILYATPLLWIWARRRSGRLQVSIAAGLFVTCWSGMLLFGVQLIAIQRPILATFITPLDARIGREYWNKLEPGALIFDPVVYRAPTLFGRFTKSSPSWYASDPSWEALETSPDPRRIRAAGFGYVYLDKDYFDGLTASQQALFGDACVKQVVQVDGIHSEQNYARDFRRLLNIHSCQ